MSSQVLIALGSNLGDRQGHLAAATQGLAALGKIVAAAPIYESAPKGGVADQAFLNSALILATSLAPLDLLKALQSIEARAGRIRTERWANRTLDLDIILWSAATGTALSMVTPALTIPHPECLMRQFVLVPAAVIAGSWIHPHSQKTLREHLCALEEKEGREPWAPYCP